jgi:hypothetical protein
VLCRRVSRNRPPRQQRRKALRRREDRAWAGDRIPEFTYLRKRASLSRRVLLADVLGSEWSETEMGQTAVRRVIAPGEMYRRHSLDLVCSGGKVRASAKVGWQPRARLLRLRGPVLWASDPTNPTGEAVLTPVYRKTFLEAVTKGEPTKGIFAKVAVRRRSVPQVIPSWSHPGKPRLRSFKGYIARKRRDMVRERY